ncbi:hypothetical protein C5G87_11985 [Paenibacillus peoriae]|nr:hypothetical protein C5G87_11985 [Paenibacillus peoriae]
MLTSKKENTAWPGVLGERLVWLAFGKPISLHEFFCLLMQGYDSVVLKCNIELRGSDQHLSREKNIVLLKAAILAAFFVLRYLSQIDVIHLIIVTCYRTF